MLIVNTDVVRNLPDGALVARAAKSGNDFFLTVGNRRRAGLLQTDDISSEAETEIAVILTRNLLGRDVNFAVKETGCRADQIRILRVNLG